MRINTDSEQAAAMAFSRQATVFDNQYGADGIIQYKRWRVRQALQQYLQPGSYILELNAGTGEDAIYLAQQGHRVHATDISIGMQQKLAEKVADLRLSDLVSNEVCSFTLLDDLVNKGPYDCIFSNFAGLNCTGQLQRVLDSFDSLLKPGGKVVLVILPTFCLWETLLLFKGKGRTATRRFFSARGRRAKIDGAFFTCWYYSPKYIINHLKNAFDWLGTEGLCTLVPPSYIENFSEKYPAVFARLCKMENRLKGTWPWRNIGDYYILSLRKKG